jgi:hypothetical protein
MRAVSRETPCSSLKKHSGIQTRIPVSVGKLIEFEKRTFIVRRRPRVRRSRCGSCARRMHITGGQRRAARQFARWRVSTDDLSACDRRDAGPRVPQVDYCDYAGAWAVAKTCHA